MREIKYRGKRIDNGEWVYGHYIKVTPQKDSDGHRICSPDTWNMHPVIPETIGQYTGLHDKNDKEIFEGDILRTAKGYIQTVLWVDYYSAFVAEIPGGDRPYLIDSSDEIIGNINEGVQE